jgi:hypothetical protein
MCQHSVALQMRAISEKGFLKQKGKEEYFTGIADSLPGTEKVIWNISVIATKINESAYWQHLQSSHKR